MTSDWQVVATPLGKFSCMRCGLAFRDPLLPRPIQFDTGYGLYAHAPGGIAEQKRQSAYASWIAESVPAPGRVLDVGCGNGSLLLALGERWPAAEVMGCDPSPDSVRFAREAGIHAWIGTAAELPTDQRVDLLISVNVIEHTADPCGFVGMLAGAIGDDGQLLLICPDGSRAGIELLIADHLFSFTARHLEAYLGAAGLTLRHWARAPRGLGAFQMLVASRHDGRPTPAVPDAQMLLAGRQEYLTAWQRLDAALVARLPSEVVCFGAGEAASLLRAYAPGVWERVGQCTTDVDAGGSFGDRPYVALDAVPTGSTVLVGVRPQDQPAVAERLHARFPHVVTWYDLVPSDGV